LFVSYEAKFLFSFGFNIKEKNLIIYIFPLLNAQKKFIIFFLFPKNERQLLNKKKCLKIQQGGKKKYPVILFYLFCFKQKNKTKKKL
jgi:hypothetical protein